MKRFTEIFSGSTAVLFQVALTGWMFTLSEINFDFISMELNYLLISAVMLGAYYINMFMMRRGVPVPVFAVVELLMVAAGAYAFVKAVSLEPFMTRTVVINCIIYCLGFAVAAYVAWSPTNQTGILLRFDALAVMSIILIVLDDILGLPGADGSLPMCWLCLALTLLASISIKSGALVGRGSAVEGNAAMGRVLLFVLFGIMGGIAVLVVIFAASGVKSFSEFMLKLITTVVDTVKTVLLFLYGLLERFIGWLTRFMEDTPMEAAPAEPGMNMIISMGEETVGEVPGWIYYVLCAIAAAIVVYIIFKLRKYRTVKVISRVRVITKLRRESGFWKALREFWESIRTEVAFRINCLRYRHSAPGLLVWCEKRADEAMKRRCDESGERYLLRLGESLGGEAERVLAELAELVECSFYAPRPAPVPAELYRAVRKTKFKAEKTEA